MLRRNALRWKRRKAQCFAANDPENPADRLAQSQPYKRRSEVRRSFEKPAPLIGRGLVAVKSVVQSTRERAKATVLLTAIVLVQVTWGAALIYLALHFL
jgi:hypothetical protein